MSHATAIGLDVHARSIAAVALSRDTGEVAAKTFGYDPASVAEWILSFEDPKAVYESGVTGFHLVRALRSLGVDCVVGAVSKMQRPAADRRRKNDRSDAEFLARQLLAHNVVEVFVPDEGTEGPAASPGPWRTCARTSPARSTASPTCSSDGATSGTSSPRRAGAKGRGPARTGSGSAR